MPTVLTNIPEVPPLPVPRRKRWTREQSNQLEVAGLFEIERLELIEEELISKMGEKRAHVNALKFMLSGSRKFLANRSLTLERPSMSAPKIIRQASLSLTSSLRIEIV
jgi:hypothetical protein